MQDKNIDLRLSTAISRLLLTQKTFFDYLNKHKHFYRARLIQSKLTDQ